MKSALVGTALGGLGYGLIEKHWGASIPTLPLIGRSGTVALACYFLGARSGLMRDIGIASAAIAGYSFGKEGKVSGEEEEF